MTEFTNLCGKCLHDKTAHTAHNGHLQYCGVCMRMCDNEEFNMPLTPSAFICQDGYRIKCK